MAKRVFTEEERAEYREKMLDAGFDLLKQYGMTHMSVAKITEAAGIGVSTFYNFFASKEEYVYEVLQYRRRKWAYVWSWSKAGRFGEVAPNRKGCLELELE